MIFELIKLRASRDNIWMQINGADVFRQVGAPGVEIDVNSSVAGWDDHEVFCAAGAELFFKSDRR